MTCQPIPHRADQRFRVVHVANGNWVAQRKDGVGTKVFDPWISLCRPMNASSAIDVMYAHAPLKEVV